MVRGMARQLAGHFLVRPTAPQDAAVVVLPALVLLLALWPGSSMAQRVEAELDKSATVLGDPVTLTIQVTGGSPDVPQIPDSDAWAVRYVGQQTSFSIVNGHVSHSVGLSYQFTPLKTGSLTIPSIPVTVDGKTLRTQPLKVRVLGSSRQAWPNPPAASNPGAGMGNSGPGDDVIVEMELDPPIAYVGQMIRQTLRIYTAVPLGDSIKVNRTKIPGTVEEEDVAASQRRYNATRNGRTYRVEEVSWVFYPVTVGPLVIPPIDVTVPVVTQSRRRGRGFGFDPLFDDFFGRGPRLEPRGYRTEQKSIVVRPIPATGRPPGYEGLVGKFSVKTELSEPQVKLGDSVTLTVTVEGEGNLRNLTLPEVKDDQVKVYDDSPDISVYLDENGRVISEKTFKRAIVPQVAGNVTLPPVSIVFFNPDSGTFETASTGSIRLHVLPGAGGETTLAGGTMVHGALKKAIQVTGKDILPIHTGAQLSSRRNLSIVSPGILVALGAAPGLFFLSLGLVSLRRRRYGDEVLRRRRGAMRVAQARLRQARNAKEPKAVLEHLSKTFRGYLGDKLGLEGGALTGREVQAALVARGVGDTLAQEAGALLDSIENARYAPAGTGFDADALLMRTREMLRKLEKKLE